MTSAAGAGAKSVTRAGAKCVIVLTPMLPARVLSALLALYPYMSGDNRACIIRRRDRIVEQLQEGSAPIRPGVPGIPPEILAAVAFKETHLGCDAHEGGGWGAPIDAQHRHVAGTHMSAANSLATGYSVCGSWDGAVHRFRTGLCASTSRTPPRVAARGAAYVRETQRLVMRLRAAP